MTIEKLPFESREKNNYLYAAVGQPALMTTRTLLSINDFIGNN